MSAKQKVWRKHIPAGAAAAVGLGLLGPAAVLALPFIGLWWRKAAKDAVSADLEDEMEADGVRDQLHSANLDDISSWRDSDRDDRHFEVMRELARIRKHPVFGVDGSFTIRQTDYADRD
jgi:hypothetical protein